MSTSPLSGATDRLDEVVANLPAQPVAALRVLELADDPNASARDLARVIEADPALSARVIRLANAPYYGLTRSVASAGRAVILLGFSTVRALAVSASCALLVEEGRLGPEGYWAHSVATAAGASTIARHLGQSTGDAFSAGLLHDLGLALLHREVPEALDALDEAALPPSDDPRALEHERRAFGATHCEIGARVLEAWRFPEEFVEAVARHHDDARRCQSTLARIVVAGHALAEHLVDPLPEPGRALGPVLTDVGIEPAHADRLIARAEAELEVLGDFLGIAE